MPGFEVDTSSYPKAALPVNPLDVAGKLGSLQQQSNTIRQQELAIDQAKMDQFNQAHNYLLQGLNALGPNPTKDGLVKVGQNLVNMGLVPQNMLGQFVTQIPDDPKAMPAFVDRLRTAAATHKEALDYWGQNGAMDVGNAVQPIVTRPNYGTGAGQGPRSVGLPIAKQLPITQQTVDDDPNSKSYMQPIVRGQQPLTAPEGQVAVPPPLPVGPMNPAMVPGMRPGETAKSAEVLPVQRPKPVPTAPPIMFEEGRKAFTEDQALSSRKLESNRPAQQALPLLKDLVTGIGTENYNKVLAGLSNLGFVPEGVTNRVAARQIIEKKLENFVRESGIRSDADLDSIRKASPNPGQQINPALVKLTEDAIIQNRVQAARAGAFTRTYKDADGKEHQIPDSNYDKYGQHRSTYPAKVDERAFGLDLMDTEKRKALIDEMKKKRDTFEGKKFWNTLHIVDQQGLFNTGE